MKKRLNGLHFILHPSAFILSLRADGWCGLARELFARGLSVAAAFVLLRRELLGPAHAARYLHHDEERDYRADGDGEPGEALEEEGVREDDEVYELRQARLARREARADDQTQVAYDEEDRDGRRRRERRVNRDVVYEVREQKVEREEARREEEVVHRVQLYAAHRRDDEHEEEEEEERHGREQTYAPRERAGLQLLGHRHPDLVSRDEVLVTPHQLPAVGSLTLFGGRESVLGEVYLLEVRPHAQLEVANLRHVAARLRVAEVVAPVVQALRVVCDVQSRHLARLHLRGADGRVLLVPQFDGASVDGEDEVVVD